MILKASVMAERWVLGTEIRFMAVSREHLLPRPRGLAHEHAPSAIWCLTETVLGSPHSLSCPPLSSWTPCPAPSHPLVEGGVRCAVPPGGVSRVTRAPRVCPLGGGRLRSGISAHSEVTCFKAQHFRSSAQV